jgi:hypothetical protein
MHLWCALIPLDEEMDNVEEFDGIKNQSEMPPNILQLCGCGTTSQESNTIIEKMNFNKPIPRCVKFKEEKENMEFKSGLTYTNFWCEAFPQN